MNDQTTQSVLITGAGGEIGAAVARMFGANGAQLTLFDRNLALLKEVTEDCERLGAKVVSVAVDQTNRDMVEAGVSRALESHGGVDVLFANAGYGKFASFLDQPLSEWQRHIDVNLTGTFHVCQEVARAMTESRRGGTIIVNASSGATQYSDLLLAYCASKAALAMLVTGMASELGAHRIRVNGVLPGVIETGMTRPALDSNDDQRQALLTSTPVGRLGLPEDVASAVHFLASDEASFITGHCMPVDGGQTIHGHPQWYYTDYRKPFQSQWGTTP
jgi:NAD(P)-dependent dehydrogenase (short-subunit alcohol dehydrogenase family)